MELTEDFKAIFEEYGVPKQFKALTDAEFTTLPGEFPGFMKNFYKKYGRVAYRNGLVHICHPDDLRGVVALIFGADKDLNHKSYHAFAYSAFGEIYFWNSNNGGGEVNLISGVVTCRHLTKNLPKSDFLENGLYIPLEFDNELHDHLDYLAKPLFKRAVKKLGALDIGECYGFVPALSLGGVEDIDHLKRHPAAAHFAFVVQTMDFNLIDVQGYGKSVVVRPIG